MIYSNFRLVEQFQYQVLGNSMPSIPRFMPDPDFTVACLSEEVCEFEEAWIKGDLAAAVDALVDLVYFAMGASYQMGIDFDTAFQIVHEANMRKQRGVTERGESANRDAVKPEQWVDPKAALAVMIDMKSSMGRGDAP